MVVTFGQQASYMPATPSLSVLLSALPHSRGPRPSTTETVSMPRYKEIPKAGCYIDGHSSTVPLDHHHPPSHQPSPFMVTGKKFKSKRPIRAFFHLCLARLQTFAGVQEGRAESIPGNLHDCFCSTTYTEANKRHYELGRTRRTACRQTRHHTHLIIRYAKSYHGRMMAFR